MPDGSNPIIQPPNLLVTKTNPTTGQQQQAFPLQTEAWLKMQNVVQIALQFPLSRSSFNDLYGDFSDEATVEQAVDILSSINQTASAYGDPTTLISDLTKFQSANTAPDTIYGNGVWLASQTQVTAQQIVSLLNIGLTTIGNISDPKTRLDDLTQLLTGPGGVDPLANALKDNIDSFNTKTTDYYNRLNAELTGSTNSLEWYLAQADNVLEEAQKAVSDDADAIKQMNKDLKKLNDEYIGFTVAASSSPLLLLVPVFGPVLAVADAATFGTLAAKVKQEIDELNKKLKTVEKDQQQKSALVTQLTGFNAQAEDVDADGKAFLQTISTMIACWVEFSTQVQTRLKELSPDDLKDWSQFMQQIEFQSAIDGWKLIEQKSEEFYQTGFVRFSTDTSSN
ncbi:hypothetical protein [Pararhodospirillum oryzae]|uniref:Uncharacterized protein n=1 Tax=Pararhodospirillum oryzae TaxID=478448 RepID=A0A512H6L3_9PROT|nr:hypothetical protein [Pararhodospirillum oryzae]GEO81115.1 hypothetical protein ROR02_12460 [Pararhodospirillum oryzae]